MKRAHSILLAGLLLLSLAACSNQTATHLFQSTQAKVQSTGQIRICYKIIQEVAYAVNDIYHEKYTEDFHLEQTIQQDGEVNASALLTPQMQIAVKQLTGVHEILSGQYDKHGDPKKAYKHLYTDNWYWKDDSVYKHQGRLNAAWEGSGLKGYLESGQLPAGMELISVSDVLDSKKAVTFAVEDGSELDEAINYYFSRYGLADYWNMKLPMEQIKAKLVFDSDGLLESGTVDFYLNSTTEERVLSGTCSLTFTVVGYTFNEALSIPDNPDTSRIYAS